MLSAFDWHTFWDRIFGVDGAFFRALFATIYIAVHRPGARGDPRAPPRAHAHVAPARGPGVLRVLRLDLPRHAGDRADLLRLLRRQHPLRGRRSSRTRSTSAAFTLGGAAFAGILALGVQRGCLHAGDHPRGHRLGRQGPARGGEVARHDARARDAPDRAAAGRARDRAAARERVQQHAEDDLAARSSSASSSSGGTRRSATRRRSSRSSTSPPSPSGTCC